MKPPVRTKWSFYYVRTCLMGGSLFFFKKIFLISLLLLASFCAQAATFYVSPTGNDANNGTTWALAKQTIQAGINTATSGDTVLVTNGTFLLTNQISISPGVTLRSLNGTESTILNGNGVTPCALLHPNSVLDGFIVTNGYSSSCYGGIYAYGGTVQNCTISGNFGVWVGGVYVENGIVQNCTISGNTTYNWGEGGGVFAWNSTVQNCTISGNSAAYGGGVEAYYTTVENCTISGNTVEVDGGGAFVYSSIVENCFISGNAAGWGGGLNTWDVTIRNCTISSNSAYESGGGISHWGGTVQYCTINENTANWGAGVGAWEPDAIIENCLISGNTATNGGGGALVAWGGTVQNCILSGNKAMAHEHPSFNFISPSCGGGVLAIWGGIVQNCQINGNWSGDFGGGVYAFDSLVQSCTLNENAAYFDGGGACVGQGKLWNCLVRGNAASDFGGGVYSYSSTVYNCTISGNTANDGGGLYNSDSNTVQNCIVYFNQNGDVNGTISNISYSCIGIEIEGVGNITNEPQFVSIGSGYGTNLVPGNYHLQADSPCLNAGTNQPWMENAVDLDGRPRILCDVVDMGAYEGSSADIIIMRNPTILSNRCGYGSNATGQTIEVWNAGTGAMAYALSANVNWLSFSPTSGTSTGEIDLVSVNYASAGLARGIYTGIVSITSAEACNSPQIVMVYLWVDKIDQTVTFPAISSQTVTSQVGLAATASSGLPVSFAVVSGPAVISGGTNLSFTAAGTVRVVASQGGDAIYNPAPNVTIAVAVERISQTITFLAITDQTVIPQVGLAATASSGLPVNFAVASGPGTISGGTNLLFMAVGSVLIVASQGGNTIYNPAPSVTNVVAFLRIGQTIYVSPTGNDANNGTSWELAKQTIQAGINVAIVGDTVLVMDGLYMLTNQISIPSSVTVCSVNGAQATIIDGGGVTRCVYMNTNAVLDGFTVMNGYYISRGAGVHVEGGTVQNCIISDSTVYGCSQYGGVGGGGVYAVCSSVRNCTIGGNTIHYGFGGGVYAYNSTVQNCTIRENTGTSDLGVYSAGGGVCAVDSTVEGCTINGNWAFYGGGVLLRGGTIENCMISGNTGYFFGGGVSQFSGNGPYFNTPGTVRNCMISGNTSYYQAGGVVLSGGTVENCTISGNSGYCNGAGGVLLWHGTLQDCTISGNTTDNSGGGVYVVGGTLRNCTIGGNTAGYMGGGVDVSVFHIGVTVENCTISGNTAGYGGGVSTGGSTVRNCTISGNSAYFGGGVYVYVYGLYTGGMVENCTISGNAAHDSGGGVYAAGGTVRNCIAYYNQNGDANGAAISYSCIGTNIAGVGNITNEPQFVSMGMGYGTNLVLGDYHLRPTSPCINAGTNQSGMASTADLDGLPRIMGGVVDMGAYEWIGTNIAIMRNLAMLSNRCGYGSNATNQTFEVWNAGTGIMDYTLSADVNWLSLSPVSGTSTGETDRVSVNYENAGLAPGTYTGIVTIISSEAINSPQVVTVYLQVDKIEQTVTFPAISAQTVTSQVRLAATASSGLPVSFTVVSGPGTITDGTNLTFTAAGTVQIVASQPGDAIYNPAPNVTNEVLVERIGQTITFPPIPAQTTTSQVGLVAMASSGLPVSFVVASGPGVIVGGTNLRFTAAGIVRVVASQAGNAIYNPAPNVTNMVGVECAGQTISFPAIPGQTVTSQVRLVATASSGLPVSFTVVYGPGTIIGRNLIFTSAGMVQIVASQSGNEIYYPAPNVTNTVEVGRASQMITFPAIPAQVITSEVTLLATASSGLPVNFAVASGPGMIIGENNLMFTATGIVQVVASQSGNSNWEAPTPVTNTVITMNPPAGEIRFAQTNMVVNEDGVSVELRVVRTNGNYGVVSVDYTNVEVTASAGLDYGVVTGQLTWADGDVSEKVITIHVMDDSADEPAELFEAVLTNAVGASISGSSVASVTIVDNDEPPVNTAGIEVSNFKLEPGNLWAGDHPAMISFDLINNGPRDIVAPGTQMEIHFYLSSNMNFGDEDDIAIGTTTEDVSLQAGTRTTIRYPGRPHNPDVTIPEGLSGDFYVFVSVRLVSQSGLSDPDGAYAMRDGPIRVRIHPSDNDHRSVVNDFDGDGVSDMMAYDEPSGDWAIRLSESGEWVQFAFGGPGYETAPGDFDGDIKADPAVHNKNGSQWYVMLSGTEYQTINFDFGGESETKGAVGDYNGDGLADPGLYEEANGRWHVLMPNTENGSYQTASVVLGGLGYMPVAGDYDGDGRADPAVYAEETGEWRVMLSDKGYEVVEAVLGGPGCRAVVGDYDGDGKSDPAVVSATGEWYYWLSSRGYALSGPDAFGKSGPGFAGGSAEASIPVPGDYDGDGKADPAIMSATGGWYIWLSGSSYTIDGPYPGYFTKIREMSGLKLNGAKISPGSPQARPPQTVLPSKMEGESAVWRMSRQQNGAKALNLAPSGLQLKIANSAIGGISR